jgi:tRNA (mo5U34)-methyltransferase
MERTEKVARINARKWYHSIEIEPGLVTPGSLPLPTLRNTAKYAQLPASLRGLTVLDVGAWDGFYSFEAERRGADRVVAYDLSPPDFFGFADAREMLNSRVEYLQGSVYDLKPEFCGTFDVVFFFGVFYHLRHPLLALDRLWSVTKQYLLMETHCLDENLVLPDGSTKPLRKIDRRLATVPLYQFFPRDELSRGDFSNWFSPNRKAIEDSLWSAGFEPEFLAAWGDRTTFRARKRVATPEYMAQAYEGWSAKTA